MGEEGSDEVEVLLKNGGEFLWLRCAVYTSVYEVSFQCDDNILDKRTLMAESNSQNTLMSISVIITYIQSSKSLIHFLPDPSQTIDKTNLQTLCIAPSLPRLISPHSPILISISISTPIKKPTRFHKTATPTDAHNPTTRRSNTLECLPYPINPPAFLRLPPLPSHPHPNA